MVVGRSVERYGTSGSVIAVGSILTGWGCESSPLGRIGAPAACGGSGLAVWADTREACAVSSDPGVCRIGAALQPGRTIPAGKLRHAGDRAQAEQDRLGSTHRPPLLTQRPGGRLALLGREPKRGAGSRRLEWEQIQAVPSIQPAQQRGAGRAEPAVPIEKKGEASRGPNFRSCPNLGSWRMRRATRWAALGRKADSSLRGRPGRFQER
jgi:hypothetical protein